LGSFRISRQGVGVVYVGRGLEPVGVVPVELGEVPVAVCIAHQRVVLVADPREVVLPARVEVRLGLVVETVERVAQVEVMPVLVDLGGREPVVLPYVWRDEALDTPALVIIGEAEHGRRSPALCADFDGPS
jgi:hypothetical protein